MKDTGSRRALDDHAMAYAPTHHYDRAASKWLPGSDLAGLYGGTRHLFIVNNDLVFYAGLYQCHSLNHLYPGGTAPPREISSKEIRDAALGAAWQYPSDSIIKECFPDSIIKVECIGLQCVGFDAQLYGSLLRRFLPAKGSKRKAEEVLREDKAKQRRVGLH
ncbi:hypothetical protein B0H10DRAFT_1223077 [Mycena sp. CBHHK59/15]|nr:hypothetical protein B0H10DRAFT_1223077 [Mycena sp. CBHHK59/15]